MKRTLASVLGVLALTVGTTVFATPAYAQTIDVFPGESIQAAINGASSGDTIQLHEGVYEDVASIKTDGITLQGANHI